MEVHVVGSGTLLPDDRHRSAGHLLRWDGGHLLLDCGSGVLHGFARDGLDWRSLSHVAVSHFHTDHVGDLPALFWAWTHGVPEGEAPPRTLIGPVGTRGFLDALRIAHGEYILEPGSPLEVIELRAGDGWEDPNAGFRIRCHDARHSPEALAYRVEAGGVAVGYTGDTGPHPPLGGFFRGVDLLISECAVEDAAEVDIHLSPASAAELAVAADPGILVLTHRYPEVERRGLSDRMRALGVRGRVLVAEDGLRVRVGSGGQERPRSP